MRLFRPLRRRPVALLWGGLSLSAIGDQLYAVALGWIATGVFGAAAAYLGALQALVILLVAVFAGGRADRLAPLPAMLAADLVRAAALLLLVVTWLANGTPSAFGLAATVIVLAAGQAVFQPAQHAVLPALVGDARLLPAANALFDGTERSARLLGPGLLALLAGSVPLVHFITLDAASFLLSAAAVWLILRRDAVASARPAAASESGLRNLRRGARALRRHALLGYVLAGTAPLNGAWYAVFFLLLPLLLRELAIGGVASYGLLIAAYGATNLLSNIVCGSLEMPARPQFRMFGSSLLVGASMAAFAFLGLVPAESRLTAALALSALAGLAGPMKDIPVAVLRQTRLPPGDLPAAVRAMLAASNAGVLVAMLLLPLLLGAVPLAVVVFGCGAVAFGVGLLGLLRHGGWREPAAA